MKRSIILMFLLGWFCVTYAQQQSENLSRHVLEVVQNNERVNYGEFQVELNKAIAYKDAYYGNMFSYIYIKENKYNDKNYIINCGNSQLGNRNMRIRTYRIGPSLDKSIFVFKNLDATADDIGYNMELVNAYGIPYPVCDTVLSVNDDGYVFMLQGKTYYAEFNNEEGGIPAQYTPIVWFDRKQFEGTIPETATPERKAYFNRLPVGATYYESKQGQYYFLYRDRYMPYTVLIVNDTVVELFNVYDESNFNLKFSYDGKHWMATGKDCYWVDGKIRSVEGYTISDYLITNTGHYAYKAYKKDYKEEGEVVVVDGQILRRNADVRYFALSGDGRLKFRFISGGRIMEYEGGMTRDVSEELSSVYYPASVPQKVTVWSSDGKHKLSYQVNQSYVEIDGQKVANSTPCAAAYDERTHAFIWNALEEVHGKLELVIYKYGFKKKFFKQLFN
ncbi:MAG: hypothetical protein IJL44_02165 [Bacteroidales bacterium]|nr:hypothetical protein [Bacteroidales bacterium]